MGEHRQAVAARNDCRRFTKGLLVFTNVTVAILFLLGCYSELVFSPAWWPLGLLTLALFYLFLLLFAFFLSLVPVVLNADSRERRSTESFHAAVEPVHG